MICPYCGNEMEQGIAYVDDNRGVTIMYVKGNQQPKTLGRPGNDSVVLLRYRRDINDAFRCKSCGKIIVVLNDR